MVGRRFSFGNAYFQGINVSFREGKFGDHLFTSGFKLLCSDCCDWGFCSTQTQKFWKRNRSVWRKETWCFNDFQWLNLYSSSFVCARQEPNFFDHLLVLLIVILYASSNGSVFCSRSRHSELVHSRLSFPKWSWLMCFVYPQGCNLVRVWLRMFNHIFSMTRTSLYVESVKEYDASNTHSPTQPWRPRL